MSISGIVNVVLTILVIFACYYFANKIVRGSQQREQTIIENGSDVQITILSMKQNGLFLNNNPVVEMSLRVTDLHGKSWLVEKHEETVLLIALDKYQVGDVYDGKFDIKTSSILFVKDESGKPIRAK
ncbi:hypothetical protein ACVWWU_001039 [Pantoea sp. PA1]|jgi:hypothetical protein|uniref:hypothetical protein n=1 Tax=Pantoea TaxID=53335 RepID=UPI0002322FB3|nr:MULTISPECIES: hypothetical protein [Pantoea]AER32200.1 hypothetical protein PAGR_g1677 [Pantoea ananatis PA13]ERM13518.1 hypothetical protein L585_13120 [Pantoea ananatis BRT175]MCV3298847.1 hypothetical protein [Pantoea ananatis]MDF7792845.1 hypothetical protein [Pantoea ananatis]MDH0055909.1 hypothetical protein [Pantoea ananatis]